MSFQLTPKISNKIAVWALSGDTGVSSETIACIAMGITEEQRRWRFDIPGDAGDFGRCYRLLKVVPELRNALPLVADKFPKYRPLVDIWDELTSLYEKDESEEPVYEMVSMGRGRRKRRQRVNGRACYDKLIELHDACMEAGGWIKTSPCSWTKQGAGA
jgi:hypothetical protein